MSANSLGNISGLTVNNLGTWTAVEINSTTTWTVPTGARKMSIFAYSGGASGGNSDSRGTTVLGGQGGAGGMAIFVKEIDVTDYNGESIYFSIGAGGSSATAATTAGQVGGSTKIQFGSSTSSSFIQITPTTGGGLAGGTGSHAAIAPTGTITYSLNQRLTKTNIADSNDFVYYINQGFVSATVTTSTYQTTSSLPDVLLIAGGISQSSSSNGASVNPGALPAFLTDKNITWSGFSYIGSAGLSAAPGTATGTIVGAGGGVGVAGVLGSGGHSGVAFDATRAIGKAGTHGSGGGGGSTTSDALTAKGGNGGDAAANSGAGGGGGGASQQTTTFGSGGKGGSGKAIVFWRS